MALPASKTWRVLRVCRQPVLDLRVRLLSERGVLTPAVWAGHQDYLGWLAFLVLEGGQALIHKGDNGGPLAFMMQWASRQGLWEAFAIGNTGVLGAFSLPPFKEEVLLGHGFDPEDQTFFLRLDQWELLTWLKRWAGASGEEEPTFALSFGISMTTYHERATPSGADYWQTTWEDDVIDPTASFTTVELSFQESLSEPYPVNA